GDGEAVVPARGDRLDRGTAEGHRYGGLGAGVEGGAAVGAGGAELVVAVEAPGVDGARRGEREVEGPAGRDLGDGAGHRNRHRGGAVGRRAVAQLAEGVVAPGVDRSGGGEGEAVVPVGGDGRRHGTAGQGDGDGGRAVGRRAVAQR